MENAACKMWFNSRLFVINDQPLKFHLLGYDQFECRDIVRIVEAYGGKLSTPDGETIVFSEPHRFTDYDGDLYHIKCLYDSIMTNDFQDINHYRLISKSQTVIPITPDTQSLSQTQDDQTLDSSDFLSLKCKKEQNSDVEIDWEISDTYVKIQDFLDHTKDVKFFQPAFESSTCDTVECFPGTSYDISSPWEDDKEENLSRAPRKSSSDRVQLTKPLANQQIPSEINDHSTAERTTSYLTVNEPLTCSDDISVVENFKENMIRSPPIKRRKMEVNGELKEVLSRRRSVKRHSYEEIPTDISSSDDMTESECNNHRKRKNVSPIKRYLKSTNSGGKTPSPDERSRLLPRLYTEEEDRQIVQFLIDNDAISKATGNEIWKNVKTAMPNSSRTEANIRARYMVNLRYNYAKYTDDEKALAEFAANSSRKRKWNPRNRKFSLSDEDIKRMVDYLVKSDLFSRPFGKTIWKEVIEKQILESPVTSWSSLWWNFYRHVLPVIDKYVNDPEILAKFRALQSRKSSNLRFF